MVAPFGWYDFVLRRARPVVLGETRWLVTASLLFCAAYFPSIVGCSRQAAAIFSSLTDLESRNVPVRIAAGDSE